MNEKKAQSNDEAVEKRSKAKKRGLPFGSQYLLRTLSKDELLQMANGYWIRTIVEKEVGMKESEKKLRDLAPEDAHSLGFESPEELKNTPSEELIADALDDDAITLGQLLKAMEIVTDALEKLSDELDHGVSIESTTFGKLNPRDLMIDSRHNGFRFDYGLKILKDMGRDPKEMSDLNSSLKREEIKYLTRHRDILDKPEAYIFEDRSIQIKKKVKTKDGAKAKGGSGTRKLPSIYKMLVLRVIKAKEAQQQSESKAKQLAIADRKNRGPVNSFALAKTKVHNKIFAGPSGDIAIGGKKLKANVASKESKTGIYTLVGLSTDDPNINLEGYKFTPADDFYLNAITTLATHENEPFQPRLIDRTELYKFLGGSKLLTEAKKREINETMRRFGGSIVDVDFTEEGQKHGFSLHHMRGHILEFREISWEDEDGSLHDGWLILAEPILHQYARISGQIARIPVKFLKTPPSKNLETLGLQDVLLKYVERARSNPKRYGTMTFDTIFEQIGLKYVTKTDKDGKKIVTERSRTAMSTVKAKFINEKIIPILDYWLEPHSGWSGDPSEAYIAWYRINTKYNKKHNVNYSISIGFDRTKAPKGAIRSRNKEVTVFMPPRAKARTKTRT